MVNLQETLDTDLKVTFIWGSVSTVVWPCGRWTEGAGAPD